MGKRHGPWTIEDTAKKYANEFIEVYEDQVVRPDGKPSSYTTVKMKPGLSVLPLDEEKNVYLAKQFRYAIGRESVEALGGALEAGEDPVEAARRELKEEAGIEAGEIIPLGKVDIDTSIVCGPVTLFLARGLKFTRADQEGTENIKLVRITLAEAVKMVMGSEITAGAGSVLILKAFNYLGT